MSAIRRCCVRRCPTPAANLLAFLPSLATREVIAFGEGVPLPTRLILDKLPADKIPRAEAVVGDFPGCNQRCRWRLPRCGHRKVAWCVDDDRGQARGWRTDHPVGERLWALCKAAFVAATQTCRPAQAFRLDGGSVRLSRTGSRPTFVRRARNRLAHQRGDRRHADIGRREHRLGRLDRVGDHQFLECEAVTRATAPPESTPWVM